MSSGLCKFSQLCRPLVPAPPSLWTSSTSMSRPVHFLRRHVGKRCRLESSKRALASALRLAFPSDSAPIEVAADASDRAVGAVSLQWQHDMRVPLAFHSQMLQGSQMRWSTGDKELFALFIAVKRFWHLLEGRPSLQLWTDHKLLTHAFTKVSKRSSRVQRQLTSLSEFSIDIRHVSGLDNVVPDFLGGPSSEQPHEVLS